MHHKIRLLARSWLPWMLFATTESFAQITLKWAGEGAFERGALLTSAPRLFHEKWFAISIGCDVLSFVSWLIILSRHELSYAVPVSALSYFAIVTAGICVLNEVPDAWQMLSLTLIGFGIIIIALE